MHTLFYGAVLILANPLFLVDNGRISKVHPSNGFLVGILRQVQYGYFDSSISSEQAGSVQVAHATTRGDDDRRDSNTAGN